MKRPPRGGLSKLNAFRFIAAGDGDTRRTQLHPLQLNQGCPHRLWVRYGDGIIARAGSRVALTILLLSRRTKGATDGWNSDDRLFVGQHTHERLAIAGPIGAAISVAIPGDDALLGISEMTGEEPECIGSGCICPGNKVVTLQGSIGTISRLVFRIVSALKISRRLIEIFEQQVTNFVLQIDTPIPKRTRFGSVRLARLETGVVGSVWALRAINPRMALPSGSVRSPAIIVRLSSNK